MCIYQLVWHDPMNCFRDPATDVEPFHRGYSLCIGYESRYRANPSGTSVLIEISGFRSSPMGSFMWLCPVKILLPSDQTDIHTANVVYPKVLVDAAPVAPGSGGIVSMASQSVDSGEHQRSS